MRIAQAVAGFTLGQADVLRKAMGKKDPKVMAKQREAFSTARRSKGVSEKKAVKLFELIEFFAGYGFNKSHSAAYALLAYQTALSQGELPVALCRGALHHRGAEHRQARHVSCRGAGARIPVLPPDINESQLNFSVELEEACASASPPSKAWARGRSIRFWRQS